MTVVAATTVALAAAGLTETEGPDAGVVAVLLRLARTIDAMDAPQEPEEGARKPKPFDNVTIPTYLKYAEALGLTVAARKRAAVVGDEPEGSQGGDAGAGVNLAQVIELARHAQG